MVDKMIIKRALQYVTALKRRDTEYVEECAAYRRDGFRPHYCKHGTNMWTDYDNICGACEDGATNYQLALMRARSDVATFRQRMAWLDTAPTGMPREQLSTLIDWACSPMTAEI